MKNKKSTYLLILVLFGVWGAVMYQFIFANVDEDQESSNDALSLQVTYGQMTNDSFDLILNYSDPFLLKKPVNYKPKPAVNLSSSPSSLSKNNNKSKELKPITKSKLVNKNVSYSGIISNETQGKKVGLIYIDNQEYMVQEGFAVGGVEVLSIFDDKITIKQGELIETIELE